MSSHNIHHDLPIEASIKEVFDAISLPEELTQWWPMKCSGKPEEGATYNFYFGEPYNWFGKVVKCEPNKSFLIQMTQTDKDWQDTIFGFELEDRGKHIWVSFKHEGWPESNQHFRHSSYCWAILLNGLKQYVENGIVIPFENRS